LIMEKLFVKNVMELQVKNVWVKRYWERELAK